MTYLIHLGYLAYEKTPLQTLTFIPNEEIRQEFIKVTRKDEWNDLIQFINQSDKIFDATLDFDEKL